MPAHLLISASFLADKIASFGGLAHIPAILVLNKADNAPVGLIEQVKSVYGKIGYEVYAISAQNGTGIAEPRTRLRGKSVPSVIRQALVNLLQLMLLIAV